MPGPMRSEVGEFFITQLMSKIVCIGHIYAYFPPGKIDHKWPHDCQLTLTVSTQLGLLL